MSLFEVVVLSTMGIVFFVFHCFCWKNCGFKKEPLYKSKSGSFIIKKEK
jgi:hypothetical protein